MTDESQYEVAPTEEELNSPERLQRLYGIDLSLLDEIASDVCPLPLEAFGPWARWISDAAADSGAPPDYVAASLLVGAAAVTGNARWVAGAPDGWFSQAHVAWFALVGPPSHGKTPGASAVIDGLKAIDSEERIAFEPEQLRQEEEAAVAKATEAAWRDAMTAAVRAGETPPAMPPGAIVPPPAIPPQLVVGDTTGEALAQIAAASPRGLLLYRDELAGLIGGLDRYKSGGSERAMLLESYGGQEYRVSRKGGGSSIIPRLSLCVLGGLQPDRFQSLIAKGDDDGIQSRFLYVYPNRRAFTGRPTRRTDHARLLGAFRRLHGLQMRDEGDGPAPLVLPLDVEASKGFVEWMVRRDAEGPVGTGRFLAWWGKGPGRVLRLAGHFTLLDWAFDGAGHPPQEIREEALARAIYCHDEYFASHALRTFQDAALSKAERDARTIARWLASKAGDKNPPSSITLREVYREKHLGVRDRNEAYPALEILADSGWVRAATSRAGDRPGRMSERYEVLDALWSVLAELAHDGRA
jgi:hypothetical protein